MTLLDKTTGEILTKEHLLTTYADIKEQIEELKKQEGRVEMAIIAEIQAEGGTAFPSEEFVCQLKTSMSYDPSVLVLLKEEMNTADLAHCYEEEYTKTEIVEAHFKTTQTKATCIRNGGKQAEILKRSMIPGAPKLEFKRR